MKLQEAPKRGLVTMICLILATTLLGRSTMIARAESYYFTLRPTVTDNPYYGSFGGYHDIWATIQPELAKIDIALTMDYCDDYTWWETVWDSGWNVSGEEFLPPPWGDVPGWDLTLTESWIMPTGLNSLEQLMYSWLTPPEGDNIFPWLDEKADRLLWEGMHTLDALERKHSLWRWQEEFMHNPPVVNLYYPRLFEITAVWVEGWDAVVRFRDISHLTINEMLFAQYAPEWRKTNPNTLIYAVSAEVWSWNPLFVETTTEQWIHDLVYDTLYDLSVDPWPLTGQDPPPQDFYSKPALAAAPPLYMDGPNGPYTRARVPLRANTTWSDGRPFNATDVKFTFDLILDPRTKAVARDNLLPVVECVEIVNETCIDFVLHAPYPDLPTLLSNDRGLAIVPWHILKHVNPPVIPSHSSNFYWDQMLPGTGPFEVTDYGPDDYVLLERNPNCFGYELDWGPHNVTRIVLKWMPNVADRWWALKAHEIDFCDPPLIKPLIWEPYPDLREWQYDCPASNPVFFNLDNRHLSNRYVRQAIAHAIPYEHIFNNILPDWDIETAYQGKTLITPLHYYTDESSVTVHLFNDELELYEYDIAKAQEYMDLWAYSQPTYAPEGSPGVALGPVGDADFSGKVNFDDWFVWWENFGKASSEWPWTPGQDVDPDFDNNDAVNLDDFDEWRLSWGKAYPFDGAR